MLALLTGSLHSFTSDTITVMVGGFGIEVSIPTTALNDLPPIGGSITLHTHLQLRENEIALYGFSSPEELELFQLLIGITGIGPRLGLAVLSTLSPELLAAAVSKNEPEILQRVPGIGAKTAKRVLFYLKDKLAAADLAPGLTPLTDMDAEVVAALTALGYSVVEAQTAIQRLPRDPDLSLEDRIRSALSQLSR